MWPKDLPLLQGSEPTCGPVALANLLRYYNIRVSERKLRKWLGSSLTEDGVSLASLAAISQRAGMPAKWYEGTYESLSQLQKQAIVHFKRGHFACVLKVDEDIILLEDPSVGELQVNKAEFEQVWSGLVMVPDTTAPLLVRQPIALAIGFQGTSFRSDLGVLVTTGAQPSSEILASLLSLLDPFALWSLVLIGLALRYFKTATAREITLTLFLLLLIGHGSSVRLRLLS